MNHSSNRLATSLFLLAMFGIIAYAGSRSSKAQTTQNVFVTNTSSQQVPVLPAARPAPGGACIVSVANAPTVKVGGSIDYSTAFEIDLQSNISDGGSFGVGASYMVPSGRRFVITHVSATSGTLSGGMTAGLINIQDNHGGVFLYPSGTDGPSNAGLNADLLMVADAGTSISVQASRTGTTGLCVNHILLSGHLVTYP